MSCVKPLQRVIFPPDIESLLQWSALFRCKGTFGNYLGYVRTACLLLNAPVDVFDHPAVRRAKLSIQASSRFVPRSKLWIQQCLLEKLVVLAEQYPRFQIFATLFVLTYAFLSRLPSESLPVVVEKDVDNIRSKCALTVEGDQIVLYLKRRKNKPHGSRLVRTCWCSKSPKTCPYCMLAPVCKAAPAGEALFARVTAQSALHALREMLAMLQVKDAEQYGTHDFRRGHALDLQLSGAPLT